MRQTFALIFSIAATGATAESWPQGTANAGFAPAFEAQTRAPAERTGVALSADLFAGGLANPWGIATLPDGSYLVTERPGRLRHVGADGTVSDPIAGLPEVFAQRQGGLLDVATHPEFSENRVVFWTYSKPMGNGMSVTAAARGVLSDDLTGLSDVRDIFVQDPPSPTAMHYGSRIVFDGNGHVFVTTGEHSSTQERRLAQDLDTTYGKVVRLTLDGKIPADNPLVGQDGDDAIWSWGHRNVQGATLGPDGRLWTIEHGPRGGDELNLPAAGRNYGWPVISYGINYGGSEVGSGAAVREGMEQPVYYWDPVIAPGGMTFYEAGMFDAWQGDLLIGSLNPGGLVRLSIDGDRVTGEERFLEGEGRIRDVEVAADGAILLLVDDSNGGILRLTPGE